VKITIKGKKQTLKAVHLNRKILKALEKSLGTDKAIAEELGCSISNIGRIRAKLGLAKPFGRPNTKGSKRKILEMVKLEKTPKEISEELEIHISLVYKYFPKDQLNKLKENKKVAFEVAFKKAFDDGLTFEELCDKFFYAKTTTRNLLSRLGLSLRERDAF